MAEQQNNPVVYKLPQNYGIWLYGKGWLMDSSERTVAFDDKRIAHDTAWRIGGEVRPIDNSLERIAALIAHRERQSLRYKLYELRQRIWHTFKSS